jgi:hypothetical protein
MPSGFERTIGLKAVIQKIDFVWFIRASCLDRFKSRGFGLGLSHLETKQANINLNHNNLDQSTFERLFKKFVCVVYSLAM